jgi:hypothetical protein
MTLNAKRVAPSRKMSSSKTSRTTKSTSVQSVEQNKNVSSELPVESSLSQRVGTTQLSPINAWQWGTMVFKQVDGKLYTLASNGRFYLTVTEPYGFRLEND